MDGIVNKVFVEMLEKLGYDIQITYAKKEKEAYQEVEI